MMLAHWVTIFALIISTFLAMSVLSFSTSSIVGGQFIQEDITTYSFAHVVDLYPHTKNVIKCASLCVSENLCNGFYYDSTSKTCHLAGGSLMMTANAMFNAPEISLYKNKTLGMCPTSDGFKEMDINGKTYCFLYVDSCQKFTDARHGCEALGAVLFHFDDEPLKFSLLESIVGMWPNKGEVWIGLHSPDPDDAKWYWDYNNEKMSSAQMSSVSWIDDSPQQRTSCANALLDSLKIDDDPCGENKEYLCEFHM